MNEFCIVCALPHSLAADARFHVSLFFSPTIRPPAPTKLVALRAVPRVGADAAN